MPSASGLVWRTTTKSIGGTILVCIGWVKQWMFLRSNALKRKTRKNEVSGDSVKPYVVDGSI
jgi:hypothetical protein